MANSLFAPAPTVVQGLDRHDELDIYRFSFHSLRHTLSGRNERPLIQLIVDNASQRVLGTHMAGDREQAIIRRRAISIRMGAAKADFDVIIALNPGETREFVTLGEKSTRRRHE